MKFFCFENLFIFFIDFLIWCVDNDKNKVLVVNSIPDTFDVFVDDLLASDVDLLKGELDLLLMQHLFNSIDLKSINKTEFEDNNLKAA